MDRTTLSNLISQYKTDPESVYNTWFIGGESRRKAFRAIRLGVRDMVDSDLSKIAQSSTSHS